MHHHDQFLGFLSDGRFSLHKGHELKKNKIVLISALENITTSYWNKCQQREETITYF